jgi:hypothetical protein
MPHQFKITSAKQVSDIVFAAGKKIIHTKDVVTSVD